jgi:FAD/FMN-containing dehydrogenase
MGEVLLTTSRLNRIFKITDKFVHLEAGVTLTDLDAALRNAGRYYPPTPTFMGAFVGGTIATNAAGAATFKYGSTRDWVQAITVCCPQATSATSQRGQVTSADSRQIQPDRGRRCACQSRRTRRSAIPAGYFAASEMDLIRSFIGSGRHARRVIMETRCACCPSGRRCARGRPFAARRGARWRSCSNCASSRDTWRAKVRMGSASPRSST